MAVDYDWLLDAGAPLLVVKPDKSPLHGGWPTRVLGRSDLRGRVPGVAVKLGGTTGYVDIEGDGLDAEETWSMLTHGLVCSPTIEWASSRGNHRLVYLPRDVAKSLNLHGVVKIGDLEIRIGEHETYTHYSILPTMGERQWLNFDFDFRPGILPVEFWYRVAAFSKSAAGANVEWGPSDKNADSPGTLYNQAATWPEILTPLGWKKFRQRGEVTDWTRPGREAMGLSATTGYVGDKLYIFSTNASPFDANRAYDKFGAYALLHHDGDMSAAATELARQGYVPSLDPETVFSDEIVASDGEIIGFEPPAPTYEAPSEDELYVPVDDLLMPGLVEMVSRFHVSRSHRVNPRAGAVAGLVLQALLMSRRAALEDGTRPNVAVLMTGGSGVGKTEAIDTLKIILDEVQLSNLVVEQVKSQQGLEDSLFQDPVCAYVPEESQDLLMSMFMDGGGGAFAGVVSSLKRFFTASKSTIRGRVGVGATTAKTVKYPHLSVWMTGIPNKVWDNLGANMLDDGFLARLWNFELEQCPLQEVTGRGDLMLLADIVEHCRAWLMVHPGEAVDTATGKGEWVETVSEPVAIRRSPGASALARQFAERAERIRRRLDSIDSVAASLWARAYVSLCKLELLAAGSRGAVDPVVTEGDTARGIRIVESMLHATLKRLGSRASSFDEQQFRRKVDRVVSWMRDHVSKGHSGDFGRRELGQGLRMRSEELRSVVLAAVEWGMVETDARLSLDGAKFATQINFIRLKNSVAKPAVVV